MYANYREEGDCEALLAARGSHAPANLPGEPGVDITDKAFWQKGFDAVEEMIRELEKAG